MNKKLISLLAAACCVCASLASAETLVIHGDKADVAIRVGNPSTIDGETDQPSIRAGTSGGNLGRRGIAGVFVFQLPDLTAAEIANVTFASTLLSISNLGDVSNPTTGYGVDLYAISFRDAADVLISDYYHGATADQTAGVTLIEKDYYRAIPSDNPSNIRLTTSTGADDVLTEFIRTQLTNGGAGKYIFLRVSPNFADANYWGQSGGRGYNFATADNPNSDFRPVLTIQTQIPEASTVTVFLAALALLAVGILRRRR